MSSSKSNVIPLIMFLIMAGTSCVMYLILDDQNQSNSMYMVLIASLLASSCQIYVHILKSIRCPNPEETFLMKNILIYFCSGILITFQIIRLLSESITNHHELALIQVGMYLMNISLFIEFIINHQESYWVSAVFNVIEMTIGYISSRISYYILFENLAKDYSILVIVLMFGGVIVYIPALYIRMYRMMSSNHSEAKTLI